MVYADTARRAPLEVLLCSGSNTAAGEAERRLAELLWLLVGFRRADERAGVRYRDESGAVLATLDEKGV